VLRSSNILKRLNYKKGSVEPCESNFEEHIDKLVGGKKTKKKTHGKKTQTKKYTPEKTHGKKAQV